MDEVLQQNQTQFNRVCDKMKRLLIKKQKLKTDLPSQIIDGLFVGNYATAINKNFIQSNNISLVISCLKIDDKDKLTNVDYIEMIIKDKPQQKINEYFQKFINTVNNHINDGHHKKCLVNCFSGRSRSCTLALSYLIHKNKYTYENAIKQLKQKYLNAQPNSGFILQLNEYAQQIKYKSLMESEISVLQSQKKQMEKPIQHAKDTNNNSNLQTQYQQAKQNLHANEGKAKIIPQTQNKSMQQQVKEDNKLQNMKQDSNQYKYQEKKIQNKDQQKKTVENQNIQFEEKSQQKIQQNKKQKMEELQNEQKINQNVNQENKLKEIQNGSQKQQQNSISKQSETRKKKKKHKKKK